jgi:hypothetical protein
MDKPAGLGRGEDGDCPGLPVRDEVGALQRVDRDVDRLDVGLGLVAADLLADEQHRRLVALALADDDPSRRTRSRPSSGAWPSVAAASASSFSPRPMNRADEIAAASVTRTISSASSVSTASA